jgi:hypothetical protein
MVNPFEMECDVGRPTERTTDHDSTRKKLSSSQTLFVACEAITGDLGGCAGAESGSEAEVEF